nr:immunoglobulin heavy chain junction region [Macaca mulatta]
CVLHEYGYGLDSW